MRFTHQLILYYCPGNPVATHVEDIWVVPDYYSLLVPYMDKKFSGYCKGTKTQHQWKWEKVSRAISQTFI